MITTATPIATRDEKDSMGVRQVPADVYYGIQALRGSENFPMTGIKPAQQYPEAIWAFSQIKKAAATVNMELGMLDPTDREMNDKIGNALIQGCNEMAEGTYDDQFIVDVYQGGTGTSNHMNCNEILANRANEILGFPKGEYTPVQPNDHPNFGQSTNDVTPTVLRLTFLKRHAKLVESVTLLENTFRDKETEFKDVLICGRTHMQDAVPMTLGQQMGAYAQALADAREKLEVASENLHYIGLGASALGTGINTHKEYRPRVVKYLSEYTGMALKQAKDYFQLTSSFGHFSDYSAAMRSVAIELEKITHDVKLYSSGPKTGIGELILPSLQPGSSIMPGKVNPVLPELMNQVSYAVQGNDLTISLCCQNGQWQLNVMMPMILIKVTESQQLLTNGLREYANHCIAGLTPNMEFIEHRMNYSTILLTALNPFIGYANAAAIGKLVLNEGMTVREAALSMDMTDKFGNKIDNKRLDEILSVDAMTQPNMG